MENRAAPRFAIPAAIVAAFALTPSAAVAQSAAQTGMATISVAKSEAILGGSSRLAAIMAEQGGAPALIPAFAAATPEPASNARPMPIQAALRIDRPLVSRAALSGRPDVFGSVALKVARTPLDRRWRAVDRAPVSGAAAAFAQTLSDWDPIERADAVNRYVNKRVAFVDDRVQYGRADLWSAAADTLRRGRGDCEDYAIAKLQMLRAAGVADRDLYLVVLKDLVRRADHAVLVVRAGGRMLVLDNGTDLMADSDSVRDYRPILTFAATGTWTHGYRRAVAPLVMASAETAAPLTPAARP